MLVWRIGSDFIRYTDYEILLVQLGRESEVDPHESLFCFGFYADVSTRGTPPEIEKTAATFGSVPLYQDATAW